MKTIQSELTQLTEGSILFLETSPEQVGDITIDTVKQMVEKEYTGILLSVNRPYGNLMDLYAHHGIEKKNVYVVDCISASQGAKVQDNNVMYIGTASELTEIAIAIDTLINKVPAKKFVFIDSITTMLLYNKPEVFTRFLHGLLTKLRIQNVGCVLISLKEEANEIRAEMAQLCDKVTQI